jgi:hypothetical protein
MQQCCRKRGGGLDVSWGMKLRCGTVSEGQRCDEVSQEVAMPKFVVTTDEGEGTAAQQNIVYATEKAATDDAQVSLSDMAHDKLPNGAHAQFNVKVANEAGEEIYNASLTFDAQTAAEIKKAREAQDAAIEEATEDVVAAIRAIGVLPKP